MGWTQQWLPLTSFDFRFEFENAMCWIERAAYIGMIAMHILSHWTTILSELLIFKQETDACKLYCHRVAVFLLTVMRSKVIRILYVAIDVPDLYLILILTIASGHTQLARDLLCTIVKKMINLAVEALDHLQYGQKPATVPADPCDSNYYCRIFC